ncbi:hypothetical protein F441_19508 [Phytophthora nicotianae CJ01A1]|uniref:Uncharacterized protein n=3 Tax=Phytophthora nicotianae TaxID=4792 RepID=V9E3L3_PHYNI|nr:hypothetical protein F443_19674 [Phytophthora nicotianae P1569]ETO62457.1 hypothetical protein F444_19639 [Phytophthora nicotianae P1976]ETP03536.1 hypothetical protein F441_19508 [Phytophthora nicotianae CJ01A1]
MSKQVPIAPSRKPVVYEASHMKQHEAGPAEANHDGRKSFFLKSNSCLNHLIKR